MFRCQLSGKLSKPNEKGVKIVTKTRKKEYYKIDRETKQLVLDQKTGQPILLGTGWEIVEEKLVLASEAAKLNKGQVDVKQQPKANVRNTPNNNRKDTKARTRGDMEKTVKKQF